MDESLRYGQDGYITAFGDAWNEGGQTLVDFYTADAVYTDMATGVTVAGTDLGTFLDAWSSFSPDMHIDWGKSTLGERSFAAEWVWSGTAAGTWEYLDKTYIGTGEKFGLDGVSVCDVNEAGEIVAHREYVDISALLRCCKDKTD